MNKTATSKDEIMKTCLKIAASDGLLSLNMRSVSDGCHVALGTLYNYFGSKDELLIETIGSVWNDIFSDGDKKSPVPDSFPGYIDHLFDCIKRGASKYPNFFSSHSVSIALSDRDKAKSVMEQYFSHIRGGMADALHHDSAVRKDAFTRTFTESDFLGLILDNILFMMMQQRDDHDALIKVICRTIYLDN
jgi:AcrR family transcriptional regulator